MLVDSPDKYGQNSMLRRAVQGVCPGHIGHSSCLSWRLVLTNPDFVRSLGSDSLMFTDVPHNEARERRLSCLAGKSVNR